MPTVQQRQTLAEIWRSLEKTEELIAELITARSEIANKIVRMRSPLTESLSDATVAALRQKLSALFDKGEEVSGEIADAFDLIDDLK